jgi:SAM-dependent methyltransferase
MKFKYHGTALDGFDHDYNTTLLNERAVEIAVALQFDRSGEGLEVGNVLGHYGLHGHRVVDQFERGPGVENIDVFDIAGGYDWIISISTIEHVRWDVEPRDPSAAGRAIDHLASLLNPGGRMLITVPAGYHPTIDEHLATGAGATRCCTLVRDRETWRQTKALTFKPYGATTKWAESVWIGEWS